MADLYRPASIGKTGILSIKHGGNEVSRYRADLGDAEIDISSAEKITATGKFSTANGGKLESCLVGIAPKQSFNGYDHPWVGGAGKNKLPLTLANLKSANPTGSNVSWSGNTCTTWGVNFECITDDDDNVIRIHVNSANQTGAANFNLNNQSDISWASGLSSITVNGSPSGAAKDKHCLIMNIDSIESGASQYVTTSSDLSIVGASIIRARIGVWQNNTDVDADYYPMIRDTSITDATFEPYTNICSIEGHTKVEVTNVGKNKLQNTQTGTTEQHGLKITSNSDGSVFFHGGYTASALSSYDLSGTQDIPNGSYILNGCPSGGSSSTFQVSVNDKEDTSLTNTFNDYGSGANVTISNGGVYRPRVIIRQGYTIPEGGLLFKPMLRLSTVSDATFESYRSQQVIVNLGGTYYGGSLDVVTGKFTGIVKKKVLNGSEENDWFKTGSTTVPQGRTGYYCGNSIFPDCVYAQSDYNAGNVVMLFNSFVGNGLSAMSAAVMSSFAIGVGVSAGKTNIWVNVDATECPDVASFKTWLSNNPIEAVYPLEIPIEIQLTPQQINTLVGENNISVPLEGQTLDSAVYRELFAWDDVEDVVEKVEDKLSICEDNNYISIQDAFKEELSHAVYVYNSGEATINKSYLGIQKKYPVKAGDVIYLKFETTANSPWYAITHYNSSGNYAGVLSQGYGKELKLTISYGGYISFVLWTSDAEFLPSSVSEFKLYTNYVTPNNKLTDITAIGTDESGRTTARRYYVYGGRFYKDGKFCRVTSTSGVAQGTTWTLGTNYEEGDIATDLRNALAQVSPATGITFGINRVIRKGYTVQVLLKLTTPASTSGTTVLGLIPFLPANAEFAFLQYMHQNAPYTPLGNVFIRQSSGEVVLPQDAPMNTGIFVFGTYICQ